eukprot:363828-Chlamydomonas_euryale.AAC.12
MRELNISSHPPGEYELLAGVRRMTEDDPHRCDSRPSSPPSLKHHWLPGSSQSIRPAVAASPGPIPPPGCRRHESGGREGPGGRPGGRASAHIAGEEQQPRMQGTLFVPGFGGRHGHGHAERSAPWAEAIRAATTLRGASTP